MAVSLASLIQLVYLVIFLGAFGPATDARQIPTDYHQYPDLDVAYKVHTERVTWDAARQLCENEGATLAVIDTMVKVQKVAALKGFNEYVWIGISKTGPGAPWHIISNQFPMPALPWAPGKPYGSHNCLAVRGCNRGLTNENCASSLGFVCQIPLSSPDIVIQSH